MKSRERIKTALATCRRTSKAERLLYAPNLVNELRAEFPNFSSDCYSDDLTCKQTDNDLFRRVCAEQDVHGLKQALEKELGHMGDLVYAAAPS